MRFLRRNIPGNGSREQNEVQTKLFKTPKRIARTYLGDGSLQHTGSGTPDQEPVEFVRDGGGTRVRSVLKNCIVVMRVAATLGLYNTDGYYYISFPGGTTTTLGGEFDGRWRASAKQCNRRRALRRECATARVPRQQQQQQQPTTTTAGINGWIERVGLVRVARRRVFGGIIWTGAGRSRVYRVSGGYVGRALIADEIARCVGVPPTRRPACAVVPSKPCT